MDRGGIVSRCDELPVALPCLWTHDILKHALEVLLEVEGTVLQLFIAARLDLLTNLKDIEELV